LFGALIAAVELDGDTVRVAVVKTGGKLPVIVEAREQRVFATETSDRPQAQAEALAALLDALTNRPVAYIVCTSSLFAVVRTLTIPFRGQRKVAAAVQFELEPYLAFPIEELAVDYNTVGEFNGQTEVLAMGLRRNLLDEQLDVLAQAGIDTDAVNLDAVALTGLWQQLERPAKGLHAILHARAVGSILAVLYNGQLAYFRTLNSTAEQLLEAPAASAREIQNTLRAFLAKWRGEGDIDVLHLTGIELNPAQRDALGAAIGVPIQDMSMLQRLPGATEAIGHNTEPNRWEALIGAALSASGVGPGVDFNRGAATGNQSLRPILGHVLFTACIGILILIAWTFYYNQGRAQNLAQATILQEKISTLQREIEELQAKGIGTEEDMTSFADPTILAILEELAEKMPNDKVQLKNIQMNAPGARGGWLQINGSTSDAAVFNDVYNNLKTARLFRVDETPNVNVQGDNTLFEFRAQRIEATPDEQLAD